MAKQEIFRHWLAGPLMRGMRHISVDRSAGAGSFKDGPPGAAGRRGRRHLPRGNHQPLLHGETAEERRRPAGVGRRRAADPDGDLGRPAHLDQGAASPSSCVMYGSTWWSASRSLPQPGESVGALTTRLSDAIKELLAQAQERNPMRPKVGEDWWMPAHLGGTAPTARRSRGDGQGRAGRRQPARRGCAQAHGVIVTRPPGPARPTPEQAEHGQKADQGGGTDPQNDRSRAAGSAASVAATGRCEPLAGKVIVAVAVRTSSPLRKVIVACQGPAGSCGSRETLTGSVAPGARVVPSLAAKGPADRPAGPALRVRAPLMSSALPPVLATVATTTGPALVRTAVSELMVKFEAGAPPGPTDR